MKLSDLNARLKYARKQWLQRWRKPTSKSLSFAGNGRVFVPVNQLMSSPKVQQQIAEINASAGKTGEKE